MKSILLLQFRNFGDAVISLGLVEAVGNSTSETAIDVLTRPEFASLFETHPRVRNVYTSSFPIGTVRRFSILSSFRLAKELFRARRRSYDAVVNLFGDIRENLAGWLICPSGNYSPIWPQMHPVHIQSRHGLRWLISHPVTLKGNTLSIYDGMAEVAMALGVTAGRAPRLYTSGKMLREHTPIAGRIGLHVSAGQDCKRWPIGQWVKLAKSLLEEGNEIRVYCSPSEEKDIRHEFLALRDHPKVSIVSGSLDLFLDDLATCCLFIGHDSFGIHAAAAIGVPNILLNGPNVAEVWAPPASVIVHGDELLPCYPCYGKPTCRPSPEQFACIRAISVGTVKNAVDDKAHRS